MIGSLAQFIEIDQGVFFPELVSSDREKKIFHPPALTKRRGKSTFESYAPDDKTELLVRYEKNNIFNINRKKYNSIAKEASSQQQVRKPLYEHRSFFVKPEVEKDYIAKDELKRKHNLLRAILRMKQNEEQPNKESDYEQSFQRLYHGFKLIHPEPTLHKKEQLSQEDSISSHNHVNTHHQRRKSGLEKHKRLEFQHCLSWAKKHNKNGDFFAEQLGKGENHSGIQSSMMNRSLIEEISKKINLDWLD